MTSIKLKKKIQEASSSVLCIKLIYMAIDKEIKEALKAKKVIIGSNSVLRGLRVGGLKSVILASNCPQDKIMDLERYSKLSGTQVNKFEGNSLQLGEICGKPFNVLLVGVKK